MTWTMSSGVRNNIRKIAVAGLLLTAPATAFAVPAFAATGVVANPPAVVPAPLPADPPEPAPPPPGPAQHTQGEYYSPNDQDDWWVYAGTGSF